MDLMTEKAGGVLVATIPSGNLDEGAAQDFRRAMYNLLRGNTRVILDMALVKYVDSSGLGVLLSCLREVNDAGGDMKLCRLTSTVRSLFQLVRFHRVFEIYGSRREAIESFDPEAS